MRDRGLDPGTWQTFRLGVDEQRRLVIPYLQPKGIWLFKRRCMQPHDCKTVDKHDKYMGDPGAAPRLFNAQALLTATVALVCEGELDAITASQAGVAAVGVPGATQWRARGNRHWRWCFDSLDEVVVVGDGDDAGRQLVQAVVADLADAVSGDVRAVIMPDGVDVNGYVVENGDAGFLEKIGLL